MGTMMINIHCWLDWIYNPTGPVALGMIVRIFSERITREGNTTLNVSSTTGWGTDWIERREKENRVSPVYQAHWEMSRHAHNTVTKVLSRPAKRDCIPRTVSQSKFFLKSTFSVTRPGSKQCRMLSTAASCQKSARGQPLVFDIRFQSRNWGRPTSDDPKAYRTVESGSQD